MMDTIFAVSSGAPPAAIAVMRVSGRHAAAIATRLAGPLPVARVASLRRLQNADGGTLDRALMLWLPGPNTATGEDVAEFHLHGGRAVVAAVERAIATQPGARRAEPGEFTRRALANGVIDLTQAQGLGDLLEAETEMARRAAIAATEGRLAHHLRGWLLTLAEIAALIEADIDFSDEDDVRPTDDDRLVALCVAWAATVDRVLAQPSVERLRAGYRVVLAGAPNTGKSSLINALAERDVAIVSDIAGTTRDVIEAPVRRGGRAFVLVDTAGIRDASHDPIERIGIDRATRAAAQADLILALDDQSFAGERPVVVRLYPRCDLPARETVPNGSLGVSVNRPETIERLWQAIEAQSDKGMHIDEIALSDQQRRAALQARDAVLKGIVVDDSLIRAEGVRRAMRLIGAMLGVDATEAMLDALFSRFCIGK